MISKAVVKSVSTAVIGLAAGVALTAQAGDYGETFISTSTDGLQTTTVSYEDLDLGSSAGQETLYYRISAAARAVCGSSDMRVAGSLRQASENWACFDSAVDQAMSKVNAGQLATIND